MSEQTLGVPPYYSYGGNDIEMDNLKGLSHGLHNLEIPTTASFFNDSTDNIYVRPPYNRGHYETFRPNEVIPKKHSDIMHACRSAYEQVGIIKSVIDLMVELAIEGLDLVSDVASTQNIYQNWAKRVDLKERAEKFATYYLVEANVVVRRQMGTIDSAEVRRLRRKIALGTIENTIEPGKVPLDYVFYDPGSVELIGGPLAVFVGEKEYGIRIDAKFIQKLMAVPSSNRDALIAKLPSELKAVFSGSNKNNIVSAGKSVVFRLPKSRIYVDHYKKKDSDEWAKSFIYSILHDVIYNEKLRLARISALDGWSNVTRLWKLGDHKEKMFPEPAAFTKLASILENHNGGVLDLLWSSLISYEDHYPPVEKLSRFEENYESMFLGLGIPRSLVGGSEESTGTSNMFVGLRNMMKKIQATRRALIRWIECETKIIADNLGLRDVPTICFKFNDLSDQQTYYKLLLDLFDRGVLSDETILERIDEKIKVENRRLLENKESREEMGLLEKKSPLDQPVIPKENQRFNEKQTEDQHERQKELNKEKAKTDQQGSNKESPEKPSNQKGRPPGSKDSSNRNRRFKSKAEAIVFADDVQSKLDKILDPHFLAYNNVDNKRKLTSEQKEQLDLAKLEILGCLDTLEFDSVEEIEAFVDKADPIQVAQFVARCNSDIKDMKLTTDQRRMIIANNYGEYFYAC